MFSYINKSAKRDWPLIQSALADEWTDVVTLSTRTGISAPNLRNLLQTYIHHRLIDYKFVPNPENPAYSKMVVRQKLPQEST